MSDEYFGALGGSLMKELLADLQVDDGDNLFSLDQLEQELASMDRGPPFSQQQQSQELHQPLGGLPPFNVASLINTHAQERSSAGMNAQGDGGGAPPSGTDAWSLSLQNFASLSLQEDFLAADSARKQKEQQPPPQQQASSLLFEGAEEYDVKEKLFIAAPPGIGADLAAAAAPLLVTTPPVPPAHHFPRTPQNSINVSTNSDASASAAMRDALLSAVQAEADAPTQPPVVAQTAVLPQPPQASQSAPPLGPPPQQQQGFYGQQPPPQYPPGPHMAYAPPHPSMIGGGGGGIVPPHMGVPMGVPMQYPMGQPMQPMPPPLQQAGGSMPVPPTGTGVVMGASVPSSGPAWQTPHRMVPPTPPPHPPPPRAVLKVFCNPLPSASPIPATALESKYMSGRDIAYVIHGILKPVLAAGVSEDDYYLQFLRRRGGPSANPANPKKFRDMNEEMISRETKSKEWASEKNTLGYVAKANVARPRALIATPQSTTEQEETEDRKRRANLWKARVYCDQAYQAYNRVVEIWRMAPPGSVPPQVQLHLARLMKCMGMVLDENKVYTVDADPLKLLAKLGKGRTLLARVLEQALLPPNAVQALMPTLLDVTMALPTDPTTERVFRAVASVLVKLQAIASNTAIQSLEAVQRHGKASVSSPARMECALALLSKGASVVGQDPSQEAKAAWGAAEGQFMALLQTV